LTNDLYDVAVVGSGFAGSLLAAIARRLDRSVILLEKGKHPRFAIGESSTPLANLLLADLTTRYNLPQLTPLAKWGSWQRTYPEIGCGLKRGFTFYHHALGGAPTRASDRATQLLVAASPHNGISDTHWYRADFDHLFLREAQNAGVEYIDEITLNSASECDNAVNIHGVKNGQECAFRAKFVVDATGPRGFLHHALQLSELPLPGFPPTQSLYTHFSGVQRLSSAAGEQPGEVPPYPVDEAAVHHVFEGGWVWILHFNNGLTSAGVAATHSLADGLQLKEGGPAWERLLNLVPALRTQFAAATPERSFTHIPRLSFRSGAIAGKRWALLPSSAGFVDPLLSTGFTLTLMGVARLAEVIEQKWESDGFNARLLDYSAQTDNELLATSRLVASLYETMGTFPVFVALLMIYFASVSFSESAWRLGKPDLASSFLLHAHPDFGPQCLQLFNRIRSAPKPIDAEAITGLVLKIIDPFNVAGLGDPHRRNWYGVDAEDLLSSAWKLGISREKVSQMLHRSGFWQ
jgi:tetracycline 7-halogenase / FADH2 O2-dependent halogenase